MKTYGIILIAIITLSSYGKSKEESQREKTKSELTEKNKTHEQNFNLGKHKNQLKEAQQQLNETISYRNKHKYDITRLKQNDTLEFLKSPKKLLNYIFESAKIGDFSNFHYLCDPSGKNDGDTKDICSIQMLSKEQKHEFMRAFANGKIIGEPKITDDTAEVEFEFGLSANKRETMNLINRNGLWYLDSF